MNAFSGPTTPPDPAPAEPPVALAILEHRAGMIHLLDRRGRIRYSTQTVQPLLGHAPRDLVGRRAADLVHAEDRGVAERFFFDVMHGRAPVRGLELRFSHRDGSYRTFAVHAQAVAGGGVEVCALVPSREAAERTRSEQVLRSLVAAAPIPIMTIDAAGRVRSWNPAAERVFGWSAAEVLGRFNPVVPEGRREEFELRLARVIRGETIAGEESRRQRKDGTAVDVCVFAAPIRDADGRVGGTIAVLEDITERKRGERLRAEALQAVGHDLRTPLASIVLNADLLAASGAQPGLGSGTSEAVEAILAAAAQMEALIGDVADIGRVESGGLRIAPTSLVMRRLLQDAVAVLQPQARQRKIRLETSCPSGIRVRGDRRRLLQVISNLVTNALRFTPPGGRVRIRAVSRNEEIVVSVADTGCGIAESDLPFVFDRYWQASSREDGTRGLGLAIVRELVEAQGGRIWAESAPGVGSTFHFSLPRVLPGSG